MKHWYRDTVFSHIAQPYWAPQFLRTWSGTTTDFMVKKAQQRLYFLRQLRKFNLPQELLKHFYSAIIESVLCTSITIWFSSTTKSDLRRQRRVVRTAKRIIGTILPTLQELYLSRVSKRAGKITLTSHPAHSLFKLLLSGQRYRAPERPDTETVSFPKQSISWTLDIKHGTHNTFIQLFIHHTLIFFFTYLYSFHSNLHMSDLTHNCLYCIFAILYIAYLYNVLLSSMSCHCHSVALWSFGHSNSLYV